MRLPPHVCESDFQAQAGPLPSSSPPACPHYLWHFSGLFVVKRQRKERGRGNELNEIGKGRGWGGRPQKENKSISLVCLVQSLKVILKMKLESSSKPN